MTARQWNDPSVARPRSQKPVEPMGGNAGSPVSSLKHDMPNGFIMVPDIVVIVVVVGMGDGGDGRGENGQDDETRHLIDRERVKE